MSSRARLAFPPDGHVIVTCDGPEVLVYAGDDERPLWRVACEAPVASVGATATEVVAVDEAGVLARWARDTGASLGRTPLGASPTAFALGADGTAVVVCGEDVLVAARGASPRALPAKGIAAVAIDGRAARVAVAGGSRVRVYGVDGAFFSASDFGDLARAVAWHPDGFWVVAAGDRLHRVEPDGSGRAELTRVDATSPDLIACAADGGAIAVRTGARSALLIEHPSGVVAGFVEYVDREVTGLAFGPAPWLAVGIDRGDANKINLQTGAVHRTDPHPGRARTSWVVAVSTERAKAPPRKELPPPVMQPQEEIQWRGIAAVLVAVLGLGRTCYRWQQAEEASAWRRPSYANSYAPDPTPYPTPLRAAREDDGGDRPAASARGERGPASMDERLQEEREALGARLNLEWRAGISQAVLAPPRRPIRPQRCPVDEVTEIIGTPRREVVTALMNRFRIAVVDAEEGLRRSPMRDLMASRLAAPQEEPGADEAVTDPSRWSGDITVLADHWERPVVEGGRVVRGGSMRGRVFVWSYPQRRVVCEGAVDVRNSESLLAAAAERADGLDYVEGELLYLATRAASDSLYEIDEAPSGDAPRARRRGAHR